VCGVKQRLQPENANNAYGKLRQTCVLAGTSECFDWNVRASGTQNTLLNLYNSY
jgi:hypothetical protein